MKRNLFALVVLTAISMLCVACDSCDKNPNAPTDPINPPPPAVNSMKATLEPWGPNGIIFKEGDEVTLPYGGSLGVKIEYTVSDEVWARRANSDAGLSIYSCFGKSMDTIVLTCRREKNS